MNPIVEKRTYTTPHHSNMSYIKHCLQSPNLTITCHPFTCLLACRFASRRSDYSTIFLTVLLSLSPTTLINPSASSALIASLNSRGSNATDDCAVSVASSEAYPEDRVEESRRVMI